MVKKRHAKVPTKEATRLGALKGIKSLATSTAGLIPGTETAAVIAKGTKALAKKNAKRKIPGKKGGGKVRGYSSGGKVHRAGLARRRRS